MSCKTITCHVAFQRSCSTISVTEDKMELTGESTFLVTNNWFGTSHSLEINLLRLFSLNIPFKKHQNNLNSTVILILLWTWSKILRYFQREIKFGNSFQVVVAEDNFSGQSILQLTWNILRNIFSVFWQTAHVVFKISYFYVIKWRACREFMQISILFP